MIDKLPKLRRNHLDRTSFKPIYFQLAELIQNQIEDGDLKPGGQVPSERELMEQFDISRNTVRMAIESLLKDGLVYRVPTKGTFVAPGKMQFGLFNLRSFSEEMQLLGMQPSSRILDFSLVTPSPRISQALRLAPEQSAFRIERLQLADGEPMALNTSYIPKHICPDLTRAELEGRSLYQVFEEQFGLLIWRSERVIEPVTARDYEAEMLKVRQGNSLLLVEGTTYLVENQPFEYVKLIYRSDRFQFNIHSLRR
ncbi:MAG: GntR family transcriptional regulator [Anaerolineales bacterium]|jgi:GntR family transcriptional regulator